MPSETSGPEGSGTTAAMQATSTQSSASSRILAVVITYHPPAALFENMASLRKQLTEVLIVDNGSGDASEELLRACEIQLGIQVLRNRDNLGIAAALNIGVRRAIDAGYDWVATFDQDSTVTPGFFATMLSAYQHCPYRQQVALVAPILCVGAPDYEDQRRRPGRALFSLPWTAMTSGSLIKTEVFSQAGFYDETLFMDYVDYDFCLRLWKRRWKIIRAQRAYLLHRLGAAETHSLLGLKVTIKSHSPWRRYYIMRNRLIVFRRYAFFAPGWCLHDFFWIFLELTKILLFEQQKAAKLQHVMKGIADGLAGRSGQMPTAGVN
jgi:rhamnosyltransferase